MTELSYSKSFLAVVARLPMALSADHVQDPRQLPARGPVSIPPPPPHPSPRPLGSKITVRAVHSTAHASGTQEALQRHTARLVRYWYRLYPLRSI